jgi:integrase
MNGSPGRSLKLSSMRRKIPAGSVFQKTYKDRHGRVRKTATYYIKRYVRGKLVEESSGTANYDEAVAMLRKKMASAAIQQPHASEPERVRIGQLLDLLIEDYGYQNRKSLADTKRRVNSRLRPFFGEMKAQSLSTSKLREYVARRRRQETEPATINKELSWLRRSMNLGRRHDPPLVLHVPVFEMLPTDNVREGTLTHEQYRAVRDQLPPYARIALVVGYHTGARKGEIREIRRDKIDLARRRIQLPGRTTKNGKPRYLPIYGDMVAEIDMALSITDSMCSFLVQRDGKPVYDFDKAWATACKAAGVPEALFHDLRRTALTNMIEAGLSEKEAMEISGHKTRAVFDRYHIVSERRMMQNAEKLAEHLRAKDRQQEAVLVQDDGARQKRGRIEVLIK